MSSVLLFHVAAPAFLYPLNFFPHRMWAEMLRRVRKQRLYQEIPTKTAADALEVVWPAGRQHSQAVTTSPRISSQWWPQPTSQTVSPVLRLDIIDH